MNLVHASGRKKKKKKPVLGCAQGHFDVCFSALESCIIPVALTVHCLYECIGPLFFIFMLSLVYTLTLMHFIEPHFVSAMYFVPRKAFGGCICFCLMLWSLQAHISRCIDLL